MRHIVAVVGPDGTAFVFLLGATLRGRFAKALSESNVGVARAGRRAT